MDSQANQSITIVLQVSSQHPQLMQDLEEWVRLGWLSESQVLQIARSQLSCPLPEVNAIAITTPAVSAQANPSETLDDALAETLSDRPPTRVNRPPIQLLPRILTSLMEEISVVWLLFLGVFLVVVSSGVLAATQWQNFSPVGQYGILFSYTLLFWLAGRWATGQSNLQLTGRMLQIATLLLIPVNFWMIDGFQLWESPLGWLVAGIAGLSLSVILRQLLQAEPRSVQLNSFGLSWLHWGWLLPGIPLIATYVGTIGTAALRFRDSGNREQPMGLSLSEGAIAFSALLLVGRAVLVAGVPLNHLALAIGVCGWLLCWQSRTRTQPLATWIGGGLLLGGWLLGVTLTPPWQALAVSGLGCWLLADRLRRLWRGADLLALFLIGLQAYFLLWWLIPLSARQALIALAKQFTDPELIPIELIGLGYFPYLALTLGAAFRLRGWEKPQLANQVERMALVLGILSALASVFNPLVRSLYLTLATLAFVTVLRQRSRAGIVLIYLTHISALLTVLAWIGWGFPALNSLAWSVILLIAMAVEWTLCLRLQHPDWQRSAWHLGLALAALSYPLLLATETPNPAWGLIWLLTPAWLTLLAYRPTFLQPQLAGWLSGLALLFSFALTFESVPAFLLDAGIATGLMLLNTRRLNQIPAAAGTIGFGLVGTSTVAHEFLKTWLDFSTWLAIAVLGLWMLYAWTTQRSSPLARFYKIALDGWAISLGIATLGILTMRTAMLFLSETDFSERLIPAAVVITLAMLYRTWQRPTDAGFYGVAWGSELVVVGVLELNHVSWTTLAIAHLVMGLTTQFIGDWWVAHTQRSTYRMSWQLIPVAYAALGFVLAHTSFTASTGLYTFAAVLVGFGVGRRHATLRPLIYLSIAGLSIAAYELLIYQLQQASGGQWGDGITLLAALAVGIAIAYRLAARWLLLYWRLTLQELLPITHLHWLGGSVLAAFAWIVSLSDSGSYVWLGVMAVLAAYAIWQGRQGEAWVYAGVVQAWAGLVYLLYLRLPTVMVEQWLALIACGVAYGLYKLPWQTWGWASAPWRRSALFLPGSAVLLTGDQIAFQSLLITGGFYAWLARLEHQVRLSYLSLVLADWAILRLLLDRAVLQPLWYMGVLSGSLLYVVQVEPALRSPSEREKRHFLRCLAIALFCLTAFYQAETSLIQGILTIALGLGLILVGLFLKVRAYLYIGTLTFLLEVGWQLWRFVHTYSFLLWALGICMGLTLIWVAANFEARRTQAIAVMEQWVTQLEAWE